MKISPLIKHMASHAAAEPSRYSLSGVYIESKASSPKVTLAATDGRRLAVLEYEDDETIDTKIVVPCEALAVLKIRKVKELGYLPFNLAQEPDGKWSLECDGIKTTFEIDDKATFPPFREVIPQIKDLKPAAEIHANPAYIGQAGKLLDLATQIHGADGRPSTWKHGSGKTPILLEWNGETHNLKVVVMPCRSPNEAEASFTEDEVDVETGELIGAT